jgi:hypothetical protein
MPPTDGTAPQGANGGFGPQGPGEISRPGPNLGAQQGPAGGAPDGAASAAGQGGAQAASALNTFFGFAPKADAGDGPAGSGPNNGSAPAAGAGPNNGSGPAAGDPGAKRRSFADFATPPAGGAQGPAANNADGSPAQASPVLGSLFTAAPTNGGQGENTPTTAGTDAPTGAADGAAPIATDAKSFFFGAKADKQANAPESASGQPAPQANSSGDTPTTAPGTGSAAPEPPAKKGFFAATETQSVDDEVDKNLVQKAQETKGFFGVTQSKTAEEAVSENNQTKAKENKGFFGVTVTKSKEDAVTANALKRNSQKKGFFGGTSAGGD